MRLRLARWSAYVPAALREVLLLAFVYLVYTGCRLLAADDIVTAAQRATRILHVETLLDLDWESALNQVFVSHDWLGVFGDYWYASCHYVVTAAVLGWLFVRRPDSYPTARRVLIVATFAALACYLLLPTAPPRMMPGYADLLNLHSDAGWWGADASAPRGLGGLTNQLAAFPSMHAGWALWVAYALATTMRSRIVHVLGYAYALMTAIVVIGTANHWVTDVLVGWAVVFAAIVTVGRADRAARLQPA
ncbi:phosphatase PAP2 family protein [Nocardioides sp. CER19]|uniref:phosphatase PAP2 family protein n=1 Tax=Nocardioides sp. CER19 TaxID=3038538 RepID=UPI00244CC9AE|nr:phosphatase PAP2 family protein [Nocardioides sp. CER19]MDH2413982.1 phosphatase PAP2 family protein [Nocardioides sp. CER19]